MSTEFFNDQWRIPSNENQNKISNYSMDFGGTNQSINLGSDFPYPSVSTDPWSISFWIKPNSATSSGYIFSTYDVSGIRGFYVNLRSGGTNNDPLHVSSLMRAGTTGYSAVATSDPIAVGEWQHIVVAFNGAFNATLRGITIYVNGSPVSIYRFGNVTTNGSLITSVNKYIGQREDNSNYLTNCELDQVTFFDYELSQEQVTQLGAEGYAFKFANDIILFANGSTMARQQNISYSVWVKSTSLSATRYIVGNNTSSNKGTSIFLLNDVLVFQIGNNSNNSYFGSRVSSLSNYVNANEWFHVAASWDGTDSKIYINGVERNSWTPSQPYTISGWNNNFIIGRRADSTSSGFYGELSNVAFWDSGLTPAQVQTIYNNGTPNDISLLNPVGWWKLNQQDVFVGPNWTITDYGSGGNDGTSSGMTSANLIASNINGELITNPMITSPKPIAYYQLGEQSVDNGANLLVPNNSLSDYVFNFDGTDDYIDCGNINSFEREDSFSGSCWVNLTGSDNEFILSKQDSTVKGYMIYVNVSRYLIFYIASNSSINKILIRTDSTVVNNTWNHLAFTYNGSGASSGVNIYINGVNQSLTNLGDTFFTGSIVDATIPFQISGRDGSGASGVNGSVSNVSMFNYELNSTQVQTIYNNGAPNDISSLNPVAWYKLDAGEIFNNTSTEWSVDNNAYPSVYQSSLDFNGTDDYIDTNSTFNTLTSFTVSAWFKADDTAGTVRSIVSTRVNGIDTSKGFDIYISANVLTGRVYNNGETEVVQSFTDTTSWHNVVMTYNGTTLELFLDNSSIGTTTGNYDNSGGRNLTIGKWGPVSATSYYFDGLISNVSIFDTALTSIQVETLYNNGTPEASISHSPVSWWKLDNTTTGIQDSAGSNNGTNNGATEYAGFVNVLAGKSFNMNSANLVTSDLQKTSGYSPYALDFDGIDDYLTITSTDFKGGSGTVSYSFWIKPNTYSGSSNYGYFLTDSSTGGGIAYSEGGTSIGTTPGQMYLYNMTNAGAVSTITSTFIDENVWNHIVVVFNTGNIVQFYKNGALSSTLTGITSFDATWDTIAARRYPGGLNNLINANISNIAFWNVGLTSTQVTEIYNEGVPSNLNNFSGTAPVAWWQLGSNSSFNTNWTCLDEIGTNNAVSANMTNDDIVDGVGYSASGIGTSSIDIKGDAPYSTANGLSENMDVLDRTLDTPIRNTHSIELDGVDDYVLFPQTFFASNYEVSYSFWVKPDTYVDTVGYFIGGGSILNGGIGYSQGYTGGSYSPGRVLFYSGSSAVYTNAYLTENVWNHLVVTFGNPSTPSNRVMKVYKNGVLQSTHTGGFFGTYTHNFRTIGQAWANPVNGKMDEVSIFSSELSASQVLSVYNNGTPGNILPLNPALWYRFESTTDNNGIIEVSDDSGNGKTGQLRNGASLSTIVP